MSITATQKELRRSHIGSSDMAAILGLDPFRNAYDVFLEKTGKVTDVEENAAMRRGSYLEPAILNYAEDELGALERDSEKLEFINSDCHLMDHPDALVIETGNPIEAKSTSAFSKEFWGDENSDEVPDRVIIQAHVHMICTGGVYCHVPAYIPQREFQMFGVAFDKEIAAMIGEKAIEFWEKNVKADTPPADIVPSLEVIKRIIREPGTTVAVDDALVQAWLDAKEHLKLAETEEETAKSALIATLGEAEAGKCSMGQITYLMQSARRLDGDRLKAEMPDVAAKYIKTSSYRVARFKKAK